MRPHEPPRTFPFTKLVHDAVQLTKPFKGNAQRFKWVLQAAPRKSEVQAVISPTSNSLLGELEEDELTAWTSLAHGAGSCSLEMAFANQATCERSPSL